MTSFKRTQRKYVQKAYRVRNWREYETGLRARGSLTVWLGLTDGKLANWNSPRPTRRKPGRQRKYSNHAIETTVTLGLVFGLASRQTEGFLRSRLTLLNLDNDVPDHSTISRRKARLGKVASYERRTVKPVHLRIDSSGLSVHVGQWRTPPKARDYRKLHLAVDEQTSDVVACDLTSKRARDASRVASLVGQIERPIASAKADAAYDTGDVYKTRENHRAHRSPKVLIPPRKGAQLALDSAGTRQRNRNIRARSRVGKRKWYVASGYSRRRKVETTFHRYKAILGLSDASEGTGVPESRGEVGVQDPEHHDGARDTRWRDDRMTGRRSHGRLSALNGVVHQGTCGSEQRCRPMRRRGLENSRAVRPKPEAGSVDRGIQRWCRDHRGSAKNAACPCRRRRQSSSVSAYHMLAPGGALGGGGAGAGREPDSQDGARRADALSRSVRGRLKHRRTVLRIAIKREVRCQLLPAVF